MALFKEKHKAFHILFSVMLLIPLVFFLVLLVAMEDTGQITINGGCWTRIMGAEMIFALLYSQAASAIENYE